MRRLEVIIWVVLFVLVGVPLLAFVAAFVLGGFAAAVNVAAVFLILALMVVVLIPGAINAGGFMGLRFVRRKARPALGFVTATVARPEEPVARGGLMAARPVIWLYSQASYWQGLMAGLRRPRGS